MCVASARVEFTSSWIDGDLIDEADTEALSDLWSRCIAEVCSSDAVIAHHEPGDVWKGAFVEIGAALASGIPIHLVGDPPGSWTRHPLVVRHVRLDRAVAAVTGHR